ncbi:MAG: hypothetical protein GQ467_04830 [Mariprofundaceae bacterium]|nr:hypothetical protein [Mariprofundaceae bacterium]
MGTDLMPHKGMKMKVFGVVLVCLGAITALLAKTIGFELNIFYIVISAVGACIFVYGSLHKKAC